MSDPAWWAVCSVGNENVNPSADAPSPAPPDVPDGSSAASAYELSYVLSEEDAPLEVGT